WVMGADVLKGTRRGPPTARQQQADRLEVAAFAIVGRQHLRQAQAIPRNVELAGFGAEQVEPGLQHVRHGHGRAREEGAFYAGNRITDVAPELVAGLVECGPAVGSCPRRGEVTVNADAHGSFSCWPPDRPAWATLSRRHAVRGMAVPPDRCATPPPTAASPSWMPCLTCCGSCASTAGSSST